MRDPGSPYAFTYQEDSKSTEEYIDAFRQRQQQDYRRFADDSISVTRGKSIGERFNDTRLNNVTESEDATSNEYGEGEEAWQNAEGDRLKDFGVDEEADFYDEEDLPLTEILRRRKSKTISPRSRAAQ